MNLASRVILGTAAVTSFAMLVGALLVHLILRAYLSPFASHFASMRSTLGWGPDLDTIYGLVDQTLAVAFGIAILLGVLIGLLVGRELSRSVLVIGHGLARFARGSFDQPIPPVGPPELTRVAQNANEMARALDGRSVPSTSSSPALRTTWRIRSRQCGGRSRLSATA
jgi:methyl-accepting chemotaxis protein